MSISEFEFPWITGGFTEHMINSIQQKLRIAVVSPGALGGVKNTILKLVKGLYFEGFDVKLMLVHGTILPTKLYSDIMTLKELRDFDVVIYMGSFPLPSHIFLNKKSVILFVHGFIKHELLNFIRHESFRKRLEAIPLLVYWNSSKALNKIDLFICRCYTSCEKNGIFKKYVILPEFVFPDEVEFYNEFSKSYAQDYVQRNILRVLTYTSYVDSPRLLRDSHAIWLMKNVSKNVRKKVELTIIDPKKKNESVKRVGNLTIKYVKPMRKEKFLKQLLYSDIFIELCFDEELRNASIDAGLIGTPIAKLTYPEFTGREDYAENCLIKAETCTELIHKVADYLNNVEYYKPIYSRKMKEFIVKNRTWNVVKDPLLCYLQNRIL